MIGALCGLFIAGLSILSVGWWIRREEIIAKSLEDLRTIKEELKVESKKIDDANIDALVDASNKRHLG